MECEHSSQVGVSVRLQSSLLRSLTHMDPDSELYLAMDGWPGNLDSPSTHNPSYIIATPEI